MNPIVIDGKRTRIQPQAQTGPRPTAVARARLIGSLQERFGYSRKRAGRELKRRMASLRRAGPRGNGMQADLGEKP